MYILSYNYYIWCLSPLSWIYLAYIPKMTVQICPKIIIWAIQFVIGVSFYLEMKFKNI